VQGTNDSSVVSKVSAAAQGYFHDVFLQHFVCKVSRRAPLINGYYVRWRAVDHCVTRFLQITENCPRRQILSLGAGFDSLYFRLHADEELHRAVVFEVDFPDVARRKTALITSNITLRGMGQYRLLGLDIREESQVEEALGAAGLDWAAPTLILSEVVLTYMETQVQSDVVISWAAKLLPQSLFVMYEQIRPHDPFGRVMQDHFLKLNSTLHALRQYPDQGWEQCVCLDMNDFYLGLVPEEERSRVEVLEPFDEYEEWHQKCSHYFVLTASRGSFTAQALLTRPASPVPSMSPSWSPAALSVKTLPVCMEGLGMASTLLSPGQVLLTGGSSRGGRGAVTRLLLRGRGGWSSVSVEPSVDLLYHTATPRPGGGVVVYGGRSSPLNPITSLFRVTLDPCGAPGPGDPEDRDAVRLCAEQMVCTGDPPPPRWRHTATNVSHKKDFLFVFGGKNESQAALGDAHFLCLDQQHWTEIPVEGAAPEARHSHSACPYQGGVVAFGGLDRWGVLLGDTVVLRPTDRGFSWERIEVQPPPVPYSHSAHVIGEKLVVVGGVWLHSDGVPGVVVIDLSTRSSVELRLDTQTSVPWPLMLHSFCSEPTDLEEPELVLMGGGGNCFSFGTHVNPRPVTVDLR
uniref:tRNA wybutosine-synthesizing protein 4 n=1 Tax=Seriola dumerili TaxID=41447 RepID=A0A3B4V2Y8_SERDU